MKRIPLEAACNMRDLGGYPVSDGTFTRYGRLFRSDCPGPFTTSDMGWIKNLNIRTALDLRSPDECARNPSAYASAPDVSYHPCPFSIGPKYPVVEADIPDIYQELFEDRQNLSKIISHIAASDDAVVFHCAVGKDRTGVVAALILTLGGVAIQDVLADYQVSQTYLREVICRQRQEHPEWPEWVGRSEIWYLEKSLQKRLQRHGGITGYLDWLEIPILQRQVVKDKLLGGGLTT